VKPQNHGNGVAFEILKWALLLYTGYRSYDILTATAPSSNMIVVAPGLLGLDVGVLVWSHLYEKKAEGNQATLAALMTVVDIVGVGLSLLADSLMHSEQGADYMEFIGAVSVWAVGVIIFLNFVGGVIYPMLSPQAERARKEKELDAEFVIKQRAAEHDLKLAQLELANARTGSAARRLRLQATDTLYLDNKAGQTEGPESNVLGMAKDAPSGPLADAPSDDEIQRVMNHLKRTGAGSSTGQPKSG